MQSKKPRGKSAPKRAVGKPRTSSAARKRSEAAKRGVQTRRLNILKAKRSEAAKRGAETRARNRRAKLEALDRRRQKRRRIQQREAGKHRPKPLKKRKRPPKPKPKPKPRKKVSKSAAKGNATKRIKALGASLESHRFTKLGYEYYWYDIPVIGVIDDEVLDGIEAVLERHKLDGRKGSANGHIRYYDRNGILQERSTRFRNLNSPNSAQEIWSDLAEVADEYEADVDRVIIGVTYSRGS